jgi:uncharacterized protein (DUF433 family)
MRHPRSVESPRQQAEIELGQLRAPSEQAHCNEETSVRKKRTIRKAGRHDARIRHGEDHCQTRAVDLKNGGPRLLLRGQASDSRATWYHYSMAKKNSRANLRYDRVTVNPKQMNGQPCIRGMRLTVRRVLEAMATYPDRSELLREYPELEEEDLRQALAFGAANLDDRIESFRVA